MRSPIIKLPKTLTPKLTKPHISFRFCVKLPPQKPPNQQPNYHEQPQPQSHHTHQKRTLSKPTCDHASQTAPYQSQNANAYSSAQSAATFSHALSAKPFFGAQGKNSNPALGDKDLPLSQGCQCSEYMLDNIPFKRFTIAKNSTFNIFYMEKLQYVL